MVKFYHKETINEDGNFFRTSDWGVEKVKESRKDNFTTVKPIMDAEGVPVGQTWDEGTQAWVKTSETLKLEAKAALVAGLEANRVDIRGNMIKARPRDEQNITAVIEAMEANNLTTWELEQDYELIELSLDEVKFALSEGTKQCHALHEAYKAVLRSAGV